MRSVTVPNLLWYENIPRELTFPDRWDVEVLAPPGFGKEALDGEGISTAFENPIGCPTLSELASGAREVVVAFDDMTRPTHIEPVLGEVLGGLSGAGIPRKNVRFIPALGMHGAMHNMDFRKKLGEDVVRDYPVFNHNPYENCEHVGDTPGGTPVYLNREFLSCDLKVGIGCITPHIHVGFGGGGKIVLPGLAGVETIKTFHRDVISRDPLSTGLGKLEGNVMYAEVEQAVALSGMQVKVDALINDRGQITDLFVGDPVEGHKVGVALAKEHYATPPAAGRDIVVVNAYGKYNEMGICMMMALMCVNFEAGTIVLVVDAPEGQVCHYLMRSFGKEYGGGCYIKRGELPGSLKVIVCTAYPDRTMCDWFSPAEFVTFTRDWRETLSLLEADYPGAASVAVVPDGTMQYFAT